MRIRLFILLVFLFVPCTLQAQLLPNLGGDRAGTSGFQFLKVPVDARGAALGETVVSNAFDASALFWNPALAAHLDKVSFGVSHVSYFVDVTMNYVGTTFHLPGPSLTLGLSLQTLSSGEMDVTTEFEPFGTGETFQLFDMAAGLTIAQSLTDLFSYGVTTKYIRESAAGIDHTTLAFDLGIFYRIGTTGAQMAVSLRNFGLDSFSDGSISRSVIADPAVVVEDDIESFTLPTTFLLGLTYNVLQDNPSSNLFVSAQLNNPNDNAENWNVGVEYIWQDLLALRTGYRFGIEEYTIPSAGVGLTIPFIGPDVRFDYGFSQLERLGTVHRISLLTAF